MVDVKPTGRRRLIMAMRVLGLPAPASAPCVSHPQRAFGGIGWIRHHPNQFFLGKALRFEEFFIISVRGMFRLLFLS